MSRRRWCRRTRRRVTRMPNPASEPPTAYEQFEVACKRISGDEVIEETEVARAVEVPEAPPLAVHPGQAAVDRHLGRTQ